ncbi:hypothetical protein KMC50_gp36 [Ralstonia phage Claudette]|uniref:Uncharacterized protein n=2 Tax=Gervaisevirus claudettte TaxID=2846041 RepID=A0A7G5B873_9CAUD|nr:hypothetical protein KMC50_gp36 [Ralstonia phage Claudette]QMV32496.1 hypothetical protein 20A_00047 [Ralstonia phage Alix]QMV32743.1 hypothetical protein 20Ca_00036 [Ralstonia phage Claudette]
MGYNLTIGNVEAGKLECDDGHYSVPLSIACVNHENAPRDGSPTDGTNQRWPSYTAWSEFCLATGLHSMFYDDDTGLIRQHPGVFELMPEHLTKIATARTALQRQPKDIQEEQIGRLNWLEYWVKWALDNCERPGIKNS